MPRGLDECSLLPSSSSCALPSTFLENVHLAPAGRPDDVGSTQPLLCGVSELLAVGFVPSLLCATRLLERSAFASGGSVVRHPRRAFCRGHFTTLLSLKLHREADDARTGLLRRSVISC